MAQRTAQVGSLNPTRIPALLRQTSKASSSVSAVQSSLAEQQQETILVLSIPEAYVVAHSLLSLLVQVSLEGQKLSHLVPTIASQDLSSTAVQHPIPGAPWDSLVRPL